ncbi:hypothetical protein A3J19_01070 [Candidatus Daviesbacteria bacterium RIFCSPLOWO2_02_FULL_41_8]|uniref:Uncharacterized protein n=2 Tax=Patescibacteria group TaxID=1783273 RepID=A0A1F5NKL1_9BACT|nr:MAG: hypothetical protein A3J19_01070 [Candidatus Daviesbacteria bacterium RIFCSPLOWO2_02_FULL_41_8]OGZ37651.1 MAG: hypothetical protein A3E90_00430 [Candidatus Portnoybacteria bacterium RIFCSPHIGHO2_12_FULL_40_11]
MKTEDKKEKMFTVVLHSGERFQVNFESKEEVLSWINTGVAGFMPVRSQEFIHLNPEKVKEIIEWEENE